MKEHMKRQLDMEGQAASNPAMFPMVGKHGSVSDTKLVINEASRGLGNARSTEKSAVSPIERQLSSTPVPPSLPGTLSAAESSSPTSPATATASSSDMPSATHASNSSAPSTPTDAHYALQRNAPRWDSQSAVTTNDSERLPPHL